MPREKADRTVSMHSSFTLLLGATGYYLASVASAQTQQPLHTAVYTTTLEATPTIDVLCAVGEEWLDTVPVSIVMPREESRWPENEVTVVGAAVSKVPVRCGSKTMTWTESKPMSWTLSGNSRAAPGNATTTAEGQATAQASAATLTSEYTSTGSEISTLANEVVGTSRLEWYSTLRVTFVEVVGPNYPATIVRTGYTNIEFSHSAQDLSQSASSFAATSTGSYLRTTTMVQVTAEPTGES